jgi:hypothetical protein
MVRRRKGELNVLKTLNDREIQESYIFAEGSAIGEDDVVTCFSCRRQFTAPGTPRNLLTRLPNASLQLPPSIELCEFCIARVLPRLA